MGWAFVNKLENVIKSAQMGGTEISMEWTPEEKQNLPPRYGCQILLEKTTIEQAKDSSFPNDAYLIWYMVDSKEYLDLCRGTRSKIFDLYYDKFGPGVIQKIDFGYGRTNPKIWGYRAPEKKKRK
jgi:hypothetical protein